MTNRTSRARINNKQFRRLRQAQEHTDDLPPKRPRYRRDENQEWRSFECADVDEDTQ